MKYRVKYLQDTVKDREDIRNYLSQYYKGTANKFFALLKKKIERIKTFPYSCPQYEDDPDYRRLVVGDYLVFYMVNEEKRTVEIHRIFHASRDISQQLK